VRAIGLTGIGLGGASAFLGVGWACPFFLVTGAHCPSCGLTRSVAALFRGDIANSVMFHPAGFSVALLLVFAVVAPKFILGLHRISVERWSAVRFHIKVPLTAATLAIAWSWSVTRVLPS
jgi:hypothetical protein